MGLTCQGSTTVIFILAFFFWFPLKINFLRAHHHHLLFKILAFPSHGQVQTISLLSPLATSFLFCSLFTFSLFLFIDQLLFVVITIRSSTNSRTKVWDCQCLPCFSDFFLFRYTENTMLVQNGRRSWYIMITLAPRLQRVTTVSLLFSSDMTGALRLSRFCFRTGMCQLLTLIFHPHPHTPRSQDLSQKCSRFAVFPIAFRFWNHIVSFIIHHDCFFFAIGFDRARRGILCCSTWKEIQMLVITASSWAIFSKKSVKALTSSNFCHVMSWPLTTGRYCHRIGCGLFCFAGALTRWLLPTLYLLPVENLKVYF